MKKVLVVMTGGTIGSRSQGTAIDVDAAFGYELLRRYEEEYGKQAEFTVIQPFTLLSENLLPQDWTRLRRAVDESGPAGYDGIVITHGSDTLAYSAAAISYSFAGSPIPILITASNYPLDDPRSEGVRNFAACISMIRHDPLPGVFVVFEDHKRTLVHLGTRIRQSQPFTDRIVSIHDEPFGEIEEGRLRLHPSPYNPEPAQLRRFEQRQSLELPAGASFGDILYLTPYPGFRYSYLKVRDMERKPHAVLIDLYHSGTTGVRFASPEDSLERFASECREAGIHLYAAPMNRQEGSLYASSQVFIDYGIQPLGGISVEAALVKLMFAYGIYADDQHTDLKAIENLLKQNLFFEIAAARQ